MTNYKIRIRRIGEETRYGVFVGCNKYSSKEITSITRLNEYFSIQKRTGRRIENINIIGVNEGGIGTRRLDSYLERLFVNHK